MTLAIGVQPFFNKAGRLISGSNRHVTRLTTRSFRPELMYSQTRRLFSVNPILIPHSRRYCLSPIRELQRSGLRRNVSHHPYSRHCSNKSSRGISSTNSSDKMKTISVVKGEKMRPKKAKVAGPHDHHPDGLTRYPTTSSANGILRGLDWLGTVSFAASGTIMAGYAGMDSLGCTIVGAITATGGGTIRDLLLGNVPVFWMAEVEYLWLVLITVGLTFNFFDKRLTYPFGENGVILYATDTLGLGAFSVIGAMNAVRMGLPAVVCVTCGMVTATFGGIMRDILCCKPVRIVHSHAEIYSVTAITGASVFVGLRRLGLPPVFRIMGGVLSAVSMRYWATKYNITLPVASWFNPNRLSPAAQQGNDVILLQKNDVTQHVTKAVEK
mmetsp:Transcript_25230/g.47180  ORF Transcript_25230/g.47180 Transcript_25230/m.47180 type:complete len:383 (+) Transcript_25230:123-1271(+)